MKRARTERNPFLDLEAGVDDDDEEEEDNPQGDFIYDEEEEDPQDLLLSDEEGLEPQPDSHQLSSWDDNTGDLDKLLDGIYRRSRSYRGGPNAPISIGTNDDDPQHWTIRPNDEDYPLWRIACRRGIEEEAVCALLQMADTRHHLRSVFTPGSLRGYVYLEAIMSPEVVQLLERTPGIIRTRRGIPQDKIDPSDWIPLLKMRNPGKILKAGEWVRVNRGRYRGDAGLVAAVKPWGVEVLLLPRLNPPVTDNPTKRKRTAILPTPALFDPLEYRQTYGIEPKRKGGRLYTVGEHIFDYGLLQKGYDFLSVSSPAVDIPSEHIFLYEKSDHPAIRSSALPRPREWIFKEGENVLIRPSNERGVVSTISTNSLEVDFRSGSGIHTVLWRDVRKDIQLGDFVEVASGSLTGTTGWVDRIDEDIVHILEKATEGDVITYNTINPLAFHVNWLKAGSVQFLHATKPSSSESSTDLFTVDRVPWLDTDVIVTKVGNPWKGICGIVKNVLRGQETNSGLKIQLEVRDYNPATPFQRIVVDYDDVVEASTGQVLADYVKPTGHLFRPQQLQASAVPSSSPTSSTPAWNPADPLSQTPAWDPSSRTPLTSLGSPPTASSTTASQQELPQHLLLSPCLVGATLKVNVNHPSYPKNEYAVSIDSVNGRPRFVYTHHRTATILESDWVTPKHPKNPAREKGLMVVIQGEHSGKYVRRFHSYSDNRRIFMKLAVVTREDGSADKMTGNQLELEADSVCLCVETEEEKKANPALEHLREAWRRDRGH